MRVPVPPDSLAEKAGRSILDFELILSLARSLQSLELTEFTEKTIF